MLSAALPAAHRTRQTNNKRCHAQPAKEMDLDGADDDDFFGPQTDDETREEFSSAAFGAAVSDKFLSPSGLAAHEGRAIAQRFR